jgi:hypothetical protein
MAGDVNIVISASADSAIRPLQQVQRQLNAVDRTVNQSTTALRRNASQYNATSVSINKFAKGALQQAGFQIGDYAVQVANGTSKMQAFGQQGAQMLGIFGPVGAVLGAAVAIFSAFAVAAERSGKEVSNFGSVLGELQEPMSSAVTAVKGLGSIFDGVMPAIVNNIDTAIIAGGLFAAVVGVKMVRSMITSAGSSRIMTAALVQVRAAILAASISAGRFNIVLTSLRATALLAGAALRAVGAILMRFVPLAVLIGVAKLIEMILAARRELGSFGAVLNLLKELALEVFERMRMGFNLIGEEIFIATEHLKSFFGLASMSEEEIASFRQSLNTSWRGVTAGLSSWEEFMAAVRAGRTEVNIFGDSVEDAMGGAGRVTDEVKDKFKELRSSIENSMEGALMSIVDGTKSTADAFRSMASEIIKELYRVSVVQRIVGMVSNFASGFFNMNQVSGPAMPLGTGNMRPVARPSFAGGGYTGMGSRSGGVDGRGGFPAILHPNETVIDHNRGGGMGTVIVNQTINVSTGVQQTVRTEIKQLMPQIAESAKQAVVDAKRRGGSYGRAFA